MQKNEGERRQIKANEGKQRGMKANEGNTGNREAEQRQNTAKLKGNKLAN